MNKKDLLKAIANGEDSRHQFKREPGHPDSLAAEMVAFANTAGGNLFIGVTDDGQINGLSSEDIKRLNQLISNVSSQHIKPPINPVTQNIRTEQGLVVVIQVEPGLNKPYMDTQGRIWVKSGADKRHVTAREEMQRMFQQSGLIHADELPAGNARLEDIDKVVFSKYFELRYGKPSNTTGVPFDQLLQNLNLARNGVPTLTGILLFGRDTNLHLPAFVVKAVAYPGLVMYDTSYIDSEDITGTLTQQYERCSLFIKRNLRHIQVDKSFNRPSRLEIPPEVFEEILVNALVHRDYFILAPIRLLIFPDRVELISPGHLPNHLDTEQIRFGMSNLRNPALASHAFHLLPYRGLGSGIPRAVALWPNLEFADDRRGNQFKVIVKRSVEYAGGVREGVSEGVREGVHGGISAGVNAALFEEADHLIHLITNQPGINARQLTKKTGKPQRTIERWLKLLKSQGKIAFRGTPKTGGYWLC